LNYLEGEYVAFHDPFGVVYDLEFSTEGAIEILTVDTLANIVTGRIDATFSVDNNVNGNFLFLILGDFNNTHFLAQVLLLREMHDSTKDGRRILQLRSVRRS
jgi:hypothetical protein